MPASRFLKYTGRNWPNPVCSFYLPVSTSRDATVRIIVWICILIHISICTYMYIHIYICIYIYTCTHTFIHEYVYVHACTDIFVHTRNTNTCNTNIYIYIKIYVHTWNKMRQRSCWLPIFLSLSICVFLPYLSITLRILSLYVNMRWYVFVCVWVCVHA